MMAFQKDCAEKKYIKNAEKMAEGIVQAINF